MSSNKTCFAISGERLYDLVNSLAACDLEAPTIRDLLPYLGGNKTSLEKTVDRAAPALQSLGIHLTRTARGEIRIVHPSYREAQFIVSVAIGEHRNPRVIDYIRKKLQQTQDTQQSFTLPLLAPQQPAGLSPAQKSLLCSTAYTIVTILFGEPDCWDQKDIATQFSNGLPATYQLQDFVGNYYPGEGLERKMQFFLEAAFAHERRINEVVSASRETTPPKEQKRILTEIATLRAYFR
ncbi:MAG TPA: hypothetical protein VJB87_00620 [Candidatus Nanoarchaeia archaeon]|nr:hypothetical protein [Candidatus Nanoarchaeia archaeon]